jgi:hypothetical protein
MALAAKLTDKWPWFTPEAILRLKGTFALLTKPQARDRNTNSHVRIEKPHNIIVIKCWSARIRMNHVRTSLSRNMLRSHGGA